MPVPNMIEFLRLRACPTCQWNLPGGHTEPEPGCPVCRGQPVTCMVIWNEVYGPRDAAHPDHGGLLPRETVEGVVAFAPRLALDLLFRPPGARGVIVEVQTASRMHGALRVEPKGGE